MADKWPLANGNWSNAANWNDGTKPVSGDDVYADGRTVTIDEDIDLGAGSLRTTQRAGGTISGTFVVSTTRTITVASLVTGTGNNLITFAEATPAGSILTINYTGSEVLFAPSSYYGVIGHLAKAKVVWNGNVSTAGTGGGTIFYLQGNRLVDGLLEIEINGNVAFNANTGNGVLHAVNNNSGFQPIAAITINGNCTAVNGNVAFIVLQAYRSLTVSVVGDVDIGSTKLFVTPNNGNPVTLNHIGTWKTGRLNVQVSCVFTLVGSLWANNCCYVYSGDLIVTGVVGGIGSISNGIAIYVDTAQTGSVTVNGNVIGGATQPNSYGIYHYGTGLVTVNGSCIGGNAAGSYGLYVLGVGSATVKRAVGNNCGPGGGLNLVCGVFASRPAGTYAGRVTVEELEFGPYGMSPVWGPVFLSPTTNSVAVMRKADLTTKNLYVSENASLGYPVESDVREGTDYDAGARTGTLAVPAVGSVALGVPVDDTVGTAVLSAEAIRVAIGLGSANLDTQLGGIATAVGSIDVDFTPVLEAIGDLREEIELIEPSVNVLPLNASMQSRVSGSTIEVFFNAATVVALGITDAAGNPVDLEDLTLEFVVESLRSRADKLVIPDGELGKSGNTLNLLMPKSATTQLGQKKWALWDKTNADAEDVVAHGLLIVNYAPKADA